jgi:hypothetical protein
MRSLSVAIATCLLINAVALGTAEAAEESQVCIVEERIDPFDGEVVEVLKCWLVGADGSYTEIDTEPPALYPQLGSNPDGTECWYWTTAMTQWVILSRNGSLATIGQDVGVGVVLETTVDSCRGVPGEDLRLEAWNYLKSWLLAEPEIELSPQARGITGLETYVWASIPDRVEGTLTSPAGTVLEARAWIDQVIVDWGDVSTSNLILDETRLDRFTPYPDGSAFHIYETKTCNEEGRTGCFPEVDGYPITVAFRWQAAYRVVGSSWIDIGPVYPSATIDYPVDEIVSRITTNG